MVSGRTDCRPVAVARKKTNEIATMMPHYTAQFHEFTTTGSPKDVSCLILQFPAIRNIVTGWRWFGSQDDIRPIVSVVRGLKSHDQARVTTLPLVLHLP